MWCEAIDEGLAAAEFIHGLFVTSKMFEKCHNALLANNDILFSFEGFCKVIFFINNMGYLDVDLDKINFNNDKTFYEDDPETIIRIMLLPWWNKFEKRNALEKNISKDLLHVVWLLTRWCDWRWAC